MHLTRVFLPEELSVKFHHIHTAEQSLRLQLASVDPATPLAVATLSSLRATRLNVLDMGSLFAYEPGQQVFPARPGFGGKLNARIRKMLEAAMGGSLRERTFVPIPIEGVIEHV